MDNWKNLIHLFVAMFLSYFASLMVNPTIADVTLGAVCPGENECSLAIYLTGFQQAITGLGAVIMTPLIGNLSDVYGRKSLLTIPMILSVIPFTILAVKRTSEFFYIYYALKTITSMVCDGGIMCLSFGYLADNISEGKRVSAFGIYSGVVSAATVVGTLAARLLPTAQIFQVAAVSSAAAVVYMRIFLKDTTRDVEPLEEPILKPGNENTEAGDASLGNTECIKKLSLLKHIFRLLGSSFTFSLASFVAFFNSLAEAGVQAFLMYFLKARFHFNKDQFADIWLITYISATISNMVLMPVLGSLLGEEILLCIGLLAGFVNMLLDSIAWAPWVPYCSALLGLLLSLASPSIRCIISKQVGPYEQGIAQGCILGIAALANVASPLIFSPLSALFLSESSPFNFPGFSILCVGLAWFIAFVLSTMIKILPVLSRRRSQPCTLA
ncbi:hippocampus abundant transcript-like protein 1 [Dorcoceras hygrometricum]|uniref:Hippocampus abundant transcript-like protein 1 n=1 Tax=Dorcoceras hygrometricum TaxID=472368 RepID=A0A2Z7BWP3_9LAMI|nr:hippocampus abundant transcript-like protein 1 [Dorcoceras hygrometricum]